MSLTGAIISNHTKPNDGSEKNFRNDYIKLQRYLFGNCIKLIKN